MKTVASSASVACLISGLIVSACLVPVPAGAMPLPGGVTNFVWDTGGAVYSSPAIARDGSIYVASDNGKLYAFNPAGGTNRVWDMEGLPVGASSPVIGPDDRIYIDPPLKMKIFSFNPDGTTNRIFSLSKNMVGSTPAISRDGTLYVHAGDSSDYLYALTPSGATSHVWKLSDFGGGSYASPAIAPDGTIYVGCEDNPGLNVLHALNPDGTTAHVWRADSYIHSSPSLGADGSIYVGTVNPTLWSFNPGGTTNRAWNVTAGGTLLSSPSVGPDGSIYAADNKGGYYSFNPAGGTNWSVTASASLIYSSPAVTVSNVSYIAYTNGRVLAVSGDGMMICGWDLPGQIYASPAVGRDGTVYIGTLEGKFYALAGVGGALADSPWPKYRQNLENTGGGLGKVGNLAASKGLTNVVNLCWSPVQFAQGYEIWSATTNCLAAASIRASCATTSYQDTAVTADVTNYYWIKATNTYVAGDFSAPDSGVARPAPLPAVPTGLSASKGLYTQHVLAEWHGSLGASAYNLWRSGTNDVSGAARLACGITGTNYADSSAVPGVTYYYWVSATNASGESALGSPDSGWRKDISTGVCADFDGDGKGDPAVYDEAAGIWKVMLSSANYAIVSTYINGLGGPGYASVAADFDGDGKADPSVYNELTGHWVIVLSSANYQASVPLAQSLGGAGFTGMPADYDGDAKADPGVYNRDNGDWKVMLSSANYTVIELNSLLGGTNATPAAADYDGDRIADPAVCGQHSGYWVIRLSSAGYLELALTQPLGGEGYMPVPADYDGDAKADPAVKNTTGNEWIVMFSTGNYTPVPMTLVFD